MKTKEVAYVVSPREPHFVGDGFRVHNFIPNAYGMDMKNMDPFILLDYNSKYSFPPSEIPKGVGVHPHKGFETVTIAYKGRVEHGDSSGGGGVIGEGDVQWMTAASGVLHKEFHETEWSKKGGEFQMVQLWVNLPAKDKKSAPKYQALKNAEINRYQLPDGTGELEVIAGEYQGVQGSASTFTPIHMYNLKAKAGSISSYSFPANYNTIALVLSGEILVNNQELVPTDHVALLKNEGEEFTIEVKEDAVVLVLSGEPINEPIAHYGPFVMNTQEELREAFEEFNQGKFGYLAD
ncbi:pirin family protein [Sphingobacteriaceae bacterium WQ 2009]|uniref:Pirin family protein n=1 Tax=Rhinopithecimicrobium faecis TaxID=2820698 RepID=A0A8T4HGJ9_9SPHI|nr:pirin family protein [Sphingobacteriaceae bacterium WQ 2009]